MATDVRINQVTNDLNVTDATAMLTPHVLERIVQAAIKRIQEIQRDERQQARDFDIRGRRTRE